MIIGIQTCSLLCSLYLLSCCFFAYSLIEPVLIHSRTRLTIVVYGKFQKSESWVSETCGGGLSRRDGCEENETNVDRLALFE